jgi:hypothetical protein
VFEKYIQKTLGTVVLNFGFSQQAGIQERNAARVISIHFIIWLLIFNSFINFSYLIYKPRDALCAILKKIYQYLHALLNHD